MRAPPTGTMQQLRTTAPANADTGSAGGDNSWTIAWLAAVTGGARTMSQRKLSSVASHGGIEAACRAAREMGVHLAMGTDEQGEQLVFASVHPLVVLC